MYKVLMVCLGNICRSPLAQGILEKKSKENNINIYVDSAGTSGWHVGSSPDLRSINVAKKHYIDISNQKARKFSTYDFKEFDKIYVMDTMVRLQIQPQQLVHSGVYLGILNVMVLAMVAAVFQKTLKH